MIAQIQQIGNDIDGEAEFNHSGFGTSINADGSIIAVGAIFNDDSGTNAGHVRVYQNINESWTQLGNDIDGEADNDWSGYSVSLNSIGNIIAIGAPQNDGQNLFNGHVRIFELIGGIWTQIGEDIDGEDTGDKSGWSVSLDASGSIVAIGSYENDDMGMNSGQVRIFQFNGNDWEQLGNDIDGEAIDDFSGWSVSLNTNGDVVAIGAPRNDGSASRAGHVRVYQFNSGDWIQKGNDIDGEAEDDFSGHSVSLNGDGNIVAIGAHLNDGSYNRAGHTRVYHYISNEWVQVGNDIDGDAEDDLSGGSVSISDDGNIVAIGAKLNDDSGVDSGHVRLFQFNGNDWEQIGNDIDGENENDNSGESISLSSNGSTLLVGAPFNDSSGEDAGHVRVYSASILDIKDITFASQINFFPNPTKNLINIDLGVYYAEISVLITNQIGQIIDLKTIKNSKIIDLKLGAESGVYFIQLSTNENQSATLKVLKI